MPSGYQAPSGPRNIIERQKNCLCHRIPQTQKLSHDAVLGTELRLLSTKLWLNQQVKENLLAEYLVWR